MKLRTPEARDPFVRVARRIAALGAWWHGARLSGIAHLPPGPALLVGNHGLFGLETPVFFHLLLEATGRFPVGLADRTLFGRGPLRAALARIGGVPGTRDNARALLGDGHLVVCYPGGSREVFKARDTRYRLQWQGAEGFAHVALEAGVPLVPFAGLGVDDTWLHLGHAPGTTRLFGRYAAPLALGVGPLPLPLPLTFRLGAPLWPSRFPASARELKRRVQASVEALLDGESCEVARRGEDPIDTAAAVR